MVLIRRDGRAFRCRRFHAQTLQVCRRCVFVMPGRRPVRRGCQQWRAAFGVPDDVEIDFAVVVARHGQQFPEVCMALFGSSPAARRPVNGPAMLILCLIPRRERRGEYRSAVNLGEPGCPGNNAQQVSGMSVLPRTQGRLRRGRLTTASHPSRSAAEKLRPHPF